MALAGTRGVVGKAIASQFHFDGLTALETHIPVPAEVPRQWRRSHAVIAAIEVKTTEKVDNPWLRTTLLQVLGYALLNLNDVLREIVDTRIAERGGGEGCLPSTCKWSPATCDALPLG